MLVLLPIFITPLRVNSPMMDGPEEILPLTPLPNTPFPTILPLATIIRPG